MARGGGSKMKEVEGTSTVMQLMFDSNSACLSKIMFDTGGRKFDKKIKICIILEVLYRCQIQIYKEKNA